MDVSKLQEKKAALEEELQRTERQIYDLEGEYLQARPARMRKAAAQAVGKGRGGARGWRARASANVGVGARLLRGAQRRLAADRGELAWCSAGACHNARACRHRAPLGAAVARRSRDWSLEWLCTEG